MTNQHVYTTAKQALDCPPEFRDFYMPPQYVGHTLPVGAYKSLWPAQRGDRWVKTKPKNWGPDWRPTGNPRG
jgi:hypothetical protein